MTGALLDGNLRWVAERARSGAPQPGPAPRALWIGCCDDPLPVSAALGVPDGSILVHRTLANLIPPHDPGVLSLLQYAVEDLKVRDIIVCGHHGCAALARGVADPGRTILDHWLQPVRGVHQAHRGELDAIQPDAARLNRLCEHTILAQTANLAANAIIQHAWRRGSGLAVHGWIRSSSDGLIRDLGCTAASRKAGDALARRSAKGGCIAAGHEKA